MINTVARCRKEKGFSQTQLANLIGVSKNTISSIERGEYIPRVNIALRLSKALGVPVYKLFIEI